MKINIQAEPLIISIHLWFLWSYTICWAPGLSLLRRVYRMLDSVRCCQFYPFYSSLPKHRAANNSRVNSEHIPRPAPSSAHFLLTRACGECVSVLSQDHNPCPITCLLSPLSSEPSIRMLTPPPAPPPHPSMTPHDKLAGALHTKLDSLKIPPTCKTSYINIRDKTEKC